MKISYAIEPRKPEASDFTHFYVYRKRRFFFTLVGDCLTAEKARQLVETCRSLDEFCEKGGAK